VRNVILNMTMSVDGFVAGPNGELAWMATTHDAELTADIIALLRSVDAAFMGYPTAAGMINYWAAIADDPEASQASRAIAEAVSRIHTTPSQSHLNNSTFTAPKSSYPRRPIPNRGSHIHQTTSRSRPRAARRCPHRANLRTTRPDRPIRTPRCEDWFLAERSPMGRPKKYPATRPSPASPPASKRCHAIDHDLAPRRTQTK
jgi:RibD C-terminal domain